MVLAQCHHCLFNPVQMFLRFIDRDGHWVECKNCGTRGPNAKTLFLAADAWNKLIDQPWTIMSIGHRKWAHGF